MDEVNDLNPWEMSPEEKRELEDGTRENIDFYKLYDVVGRIGNKINVLSVVVQDVDSREVLISAYTSYEALEYSLETRKATFWSTSRQEIWVKGEESGNSLELIEVRVNCEQNSLLYLVRKTKGGACHVKDEKGEFRSSCFYRRILGAGSMTLQFVEE